MRVLAGLGVDPALASFWIPGMDNEACVGGNSTLLAQHFQPFEGTGEDGAKEGRRIVRLKLAPLRVCAKITSDFGGSAAGPDARRKGGSVSPAILDRPSNEANGPAPPRPEGLGALGALALLLLAHRPHGYARSSRLASPPNPLQQNRNSFLHRPYRGRRATSLPAAMSLTR